MKTTAIEAKKMTTESKTRRKSWCRETTGVKADEKMTRESENAQTKYTPWRGILKHLYLNHRHECRQEKEQPSFENKMGSKMKMGQRMCTWLSRRLVVQFWAAAVWIQYPLAEHWTRLTGVWIWDRKPRKSVCMNGWMRHLVEKY